MKKPYETITVWIVLTGALVRIPSEVLEAGKLDGVGFFREFWQVTIPLIYPTLNTLMIFSMAGIFTADVHYAGPHIRKYQRREGTPDSGASVYHKNVSK